MGGGMAQAFVITLPGTQHVLHGTQLCVTCQHRSLGRGTCAQVLCWFVFHMGSKGTSNQISWKHTGPHSSGDQWAGHGFRWPGVCLALWFGDTRVPLSQEALQGSRRPKGRE